MSFIDEYIHNLESHTYSPSSLDSHNTETSLNNISKLKGAETPEEVASTIGSILREYASDQVNINMDGDHKLKPENDSEALYSFGDTKIPQHISSSDRINVKSETDHRLL